MTDKHQAVFRRSAFTFGGMAVVLLAMRGHFGAAVIGGAAIGVFAGAWFAYFNVLGEKKLLRQGIATDRMDPVQERTIEIRMDAPAALAASRSALLALRRVRITQVREADGNLQAESGFSLRSVGERLTVHVEATRLGVSVVRVRSEPKLNTTIVDYGKGVENVELFIRNLRANAKSLTTAE